MLVPLMPYPRRNYPDQKGTVECEPTAGMGIGIRSLIDDGVNPDRGAVRTLPTPIG